MRLDQMLIKKRLCNSNPDDTITISNSIEGLYHYYSSKNLRHKIYHPLFVAFKFSNAVKVYVKKEIYNENVNYFNVAFDSAFQSTKESATI